MLALKIKPDINLYKSISDLVQSCALSAEDVVLTNRVIFDKFFSSFDLPCRIIYQELYGEGEPTDKMAQALLGAYFAKPCKKLLAIGGGTVIDLAKVLAVARPDQSLDDMYAHMDKLSANCELIIVPTTCGTGSEVTNIAIIYRTALGTKMGLVSEAMYAKKAALVPEILTDLPYKIFAASSLDALVHSVESALSPKASPYSLLFSYSALEMIIRGYQQIADNGENTRNHLQKEFLIASNYAGIAFSIAGCAAVHALSYPLGGIFHVPHGEANYSIFLEVLRAYAKMGIKKPLFNLLQTISGLLQCKPAHALDRLDALLNIILTLKPLREYGMTEKEVSEFPPKVLASQKRLLANSYMPLSEEDIRAIYMARL